MAKTTKKNTKRTTAKKPAGKKPATKKPTKPATKKPAQKKPSAKKPTTKKTTKTTPKKPTAKKTTGKTTRKTTPKKAKATPKQKTSGTKKASGRGKKTPAKRKTTSGTKSSDGKSSVEEQLVEKETSQQLIEAEESIEQNENSARVGRGRNTGWAHTKDYPHKRHPAFFKKKSRSSRDVEYLTFTHSNTVELKGENVETMPLDDNISPKERKENQEKGLKAGENRSYVYPRVFEGKRDSLGKGAGKGEFDPIPEDMEKINQFFEKFPHEKVQTTGGKRKLKKGK